LALAATTFRLKLTGAALTIAGLILIYWFDPSVRGLTGLTLANTRIVALGLPAALVVLGLVIIEKAGCSPAHSRLGPRPLPFSSWRPLGLRSASII
jgi:hypothetical protein